MKTLLTISATILLLLAIQQVDVYLYNHQDVGVIRAQYEGALRNYKHWKPDVTDTTGAEPHDMFLATPIRRT